MIKCWNSGAYLLNGTRLVPDTPEQAAETQSYDHTQARNGTMAWKILSRHNISTRPEQLQLKVDSMISNDVNYVNIVQTARASGMTHFPLPYVLSNCHNSLYAVGGTICADDHAFGLSCAKKYGGIFLLPMGAVMHQYMRETVAACGNLVLGSDSHTRYGALGNMAMGEGGGELVKQLLGDTYDMPRPPVIAIYLTGTPSPAVGPHDVALAIEQAVFPTGYVRNKVMEFVGPGIYNLSTDFRNGIDVMTTETACLSSIWCTDDETEHFLTVHKRPKAYKKLEPDPVAWYDGVVEVDLATIKPMIALPFHPSNVYTIDEVNESGGDILREVEEKAARIAENPNVHYTLTDKLKNGRLQVQQGIIAGCSGGTYTNLMMAAHILGDCSIGADTFSLSVYPSSVPIYMDLASKGILNKFLADGAIVKPCFCGPCFGAGDTPANDCLSIRHTTRNFPNREGSKPDQGQMAAVALMDARSIAATARNQGALTSAEAFADEYQIPEHQYDDTCYQKRVYQGFGKARPEEPLVYGPNIKDWPEMEALGENLLLQICTKILDPVTSTDEFIPSGETSTLRSNPPRLAEFTFCKKGPNYVGRAKATAALEQERLTGSVTTPQLLQALERLNTLPGQENVSWDQLEIGSMIYAVKPGDGSAREQAASCQRVLGGLANLCVDYATKRYRSNVINWGMLPFQMPDEPPFEVGDFLYIPGIRKSLEENKPIKAWVLKDKPVALELTVGDLNPEEKEIIKAGCLINYNRRKNKICLLINCIIRFHLFNLDIRSNLKGPFNSHESKGPFRLHNLQVIRFMIEMVFVR